jgi:hypothetical protein
MFGQACIKDAYLRPQPTPSFDFNCVEAKLDRIAMEPQ